MKDFDEKYIKEELVKDRDNYKKNTFDTNLEIEFKDREYKEEYGYDFVPRIDHWTNIDEQKIQVNKMEDITTDKEK